MYLVFKVQTKEAKLDMLPISKEVNYLLSPNIGKSALYIITHSNNPPQNSYGNAQFTDEDLVWFLCLMAYQTLWVIKCKAILVEEQ